MHPGCDTLCAPWCICLSRNATSLLHGRSRGCSQHRCCRLAQDAFSLEHQLEQLALGLLGGLLLRVEAPVLPARQLDKVLQPQLSAEHVLD